MKRTVLLVIIVICLSCAIVSAERSVRFTDTGLKAAVEEKLGVSDPTPSEMNELTILIADGRAIRDIGGLEYATNLRYLSLEGNRIEDISKLRSLTKLNALNLSGNRLTDISAVRGLTNLQFLWLGANEIANIEPIESLVNLGRLSVYKNRISDLSPAANLTGLTFLEMRDNFVSDLSPVTNLPKLKKLSVGGNPIRKLCGKEPLRDVLKIEFDAAGYASYARNDNQVMGKVRIPDGIVELAVVRESFTIVVRVDKPEVSLPVGKYSFSYWKMKRKDSRNNKWELRGGRFSRDLVMYVTPGCTAEPRIGKPIRANLGVARSGRGDYTLSQTITGRGGENIEIYKNNVRADPPSVHIYNKGSSYDKTFKFRYG